METDRRIRDTEIDEWVTALHDAEAGGWSDLHVQGTQLTLEAMAASNESYTGADLSRVFASSEARETLRASVSMDLHTFAEIDPAIWQELSRRAATLADVSSGRLAEASETDESDT